VPVDRDGMVVSEGSRGAACPGGGGHAGASEPAERVAVPAPAPGAARLGGAATTPGSSRTTMTASIAMSAAPARAEEPGSRRARALRGHLQQGAVAKPAAGLSRRAGGQVERFEQITQAFAGGSPELTQAIVTAFIAEGHFARHIQRMRKLYAERRAMTVGPGKRAGPPSCASTQPGGMHLILRLQGRPLGPRPGRRDAGEGLYAEALTDWTTDRRGPGPAAQLHQHRLPGRPRRILETLCDADHGLVAIAHSWPSWLGQDAGHRRSLQSERNSP
jgi:GntR family transcriptional regulator/MocR family aminotransferase